MGAAFGLKFGATGDFRIDLLDPDDTVLRHGRLARHPHRPERVHVLGGVPGVGAGRARGRRDVSAPLHGDGRRHGDGGRCACSRRSRPRSATASAGWAACGPMPRRGAATPRCTSRRSDARRASGRRVVARAAHVGARPPGRQRAEPLQPRHAHQAVRRGRAGAPHRHAGGLRRGARHRQRRGRDLDLLVRAPGRGRGHGPARTARASSASA